MAGSVGGEQRVAYAVEGTATGMSCSTGKIQHTTHAAAANTDEILRLKGQIASLEAKRLRAPKQEVAMTKLQRAKKKFPKAYARVKANAGTKVADELFAHVAETQQGK
jgi:hypothetical protein